MAYIYLTLLSREYYFLAFPHCAVVTPYDITDIFSIVSEGFDKAC